MDYLLTWNFKHINNAEREARVPSKLSSTKLLFRMFVFLTGVKWPIPMYLQGRGHLDKHGMAILLNC